MQPWRNFNINKKLPHVDGKFIQVLRISMTIERLQCANVHAPTKPIKYFQTATISISLQLVNGKHNVCSLRRDTDCHNNSIIWWYLSSRVCRCGGRIEKRWNEIKKKKWHHGKSTINMLVRHSANRSCQPIRLANKGGTRLSHSFPVCVECVPTVHNALRTWYDRIKCTLTSFWPIALLMNAPSPFDISKSIHFDRMTFFFCLPSNTKVWPCLS